MPKLVENHTDFSLTLNKPDRLERIIRSAYNLLDEYKWIKEKWIISVKGNKIIFKIRALEIITEDVTEEIENIHEEEIGFFGIFDILSSFPNQITFINPKVTRDEIERLRVWCHANKYSFKYIEENNILKVKAMAIDKKI